MFKRKCHECGKELFFRPGERIKPFCCKKCSESYHEKEYNAPENGPVMPPLDVDRISDEGFEALVAAIVHLASEDVKKFSPGTLYRVDAEKFFLSEHFSALTGMDGKTVLRNLLTKREKKPDTRGMKPRQKPRNHRVRCIETGVVYPSIKEAAEAFACYPSCIQRVCARERNRAAGMHWEFVEDEDEVK